MIVSIASTTRDATGDVSDVSGSDNRIFARVSQNKPNMMMQMMDFKRRANLEACYLSFLSILRRRQGRRVPRRHSITWRTWRSLVSNSANTRCKHFCIIFSTSAASKPNLFSITGIVVMISGIAFDRPDRLSRLRAFPCMWSLQNLHDHPDRPDRTQLYPSDRGRLSRPGRLWSSG